MSDGMMVPWNPVVRLRGLAKLWQVLQRKGANRRVPTTDELDNRMRSDIGLPASARADRLTAHYRKLLQRGHPLP